MAEESHNRKQRFARQMSDTEALMWNIEQDPWLNPSGGSVAILDVPVDLDLFRRRLAGQVAEVPRLRERVVAGPGLLSKPVWRPDAEFDLSYHVRQVALAPPGSMRQLLDVVALNHQDPFDRTRPLWMFLLVEGLEGGRGALIWKAHHVVADGIGLSRLAEYYLDRSPTAPPAPEVDLEAVVAEAAERGVGAGGPSGPLALPIGALRTMTRLWGRQAAVTRNMVGELALWGADPLRAGDAAKGILGAVGQVRTQLLGATEAPGGSSLWHQRSRHRHLEVLRIPLDSAHAAAEALGGTVNDFFVAGAVDGAVAYHQQRGAPLNALNISFVVSTRDDKAVGGNAFTPVRVQIPAGEMDPKERFQSVSARLAARRAEVHGGGMLAGLAGVARLLPTSMVTRTARSQAAKMDFATSDMRGARSARYICGAGVLESYAYGPLAGTAFNVTALSYNGNLHLGLFVDPVAVSAPGELCTDIEVAYAKLMEASGVLV